MELYGVQQELARHQMMLEKNHDDFAKQQQQRQRMEQQLHEVRDLYRQKRLAVNEEKRKGKSSTIFNDNKMAETSE